MRPTEGATIVPGSAAALGLGPRQFDREGRAAARHRLQADGMAQHLADALDDRQPETEAAHRARRLLQALELLEDDRALRLGDAGAGIADQDASRSPRRRTPSSTLPVAVYLMALDTRFCSTRRSSRRSERTQARVGNDAQVEAPSRGPSARTPPPAARTPRSRERRVMSGSSLPVSSREISISTPRISSTASSEASMLRASVASCPPCARSTRLVT